MKGISTAALIVVVACSTITTLATATAESDAGRRETERSDNNHHYGFTPRSSSTTRFLSLEEGEVEDVEERKRQRGHNQQQQQNTLDMIGTATHSTATPGDEAKGLLGTKPPPTEVVVGLAESEGGEKAGEGGSKSGKDSKSGKATPTHYPTMMHTMLPTPYGGSTTMHPTTMYPTTIMHSKSQKAGKMSKASKIAKREKKPTVSPTTLVKTDLPTMSPSLVTESPTDMPTYISTELPTRQPSDCPASDVDCMPIIGVNSVTEGSNIGGPTVSEGFCGTAITGGSQVSFYRVVGTGNTLTASTCDAADFDTKIVIYCSDPDYSNFCVGGIDDTDDCEGFTSEISWPTDEDQEYIIMVFGYDGETGDFELSVLDDGIPVNAPLGQCEYGPTRPSATPMFFPTQRPSYIPTQSPTERPQVFPSSMQPTVCPASDVPDATHIEVDTSAQGTNVGGPSVPEGLCGTDIADGANVAWYHAIGTGNTMTASTCNDADFDTKIAVYCNCNDYSRYCVGGNDDSSGCDGFTTEFSWPSIDGQEYLIMVFGFEGQTGRFTLTLRDDGIPAGAPSRQCDPLGTESPTPLVTASPTLTPPPISPTMQPTSCPTIVLPNAPLIEVNTVTSGTNEGGQAVSEGDCGDVGMTAGSEAALFRVFGTGNTLTASTCDAADFDTQIAVYCNCNEFSDYCVGGNDDFVNCSGFTSEFSWPSINGQEYVIMVLGYDGATGDFELTLTDDGVPASAPLGQCNFDTEYPTYSPTASPTYLPPDFPTMPPTVCPALDVPDATPIEVDTPIEGTNIDGPTVPEGSCEISIDDGSNVAWYRTVGTGNTLTASTCGTADFDTKIVVYCNCDDYSRYCVGGNDDTDNCEGFTSEFSWPSINGQEYLIMIFGFEGQTGRFTLTLTDDGIPADASIRQCSGNNVVFPIKDDSSKYDKLESMEKPSGGSYGKEESSGKS